MITEITPLLGTIRRVTKKSTASGKKKWSLSVFLVAGDMQKIMFNDQYRLTKAVLGGWKTNTRRIIPQSVIDKAEEYRVEYYNQTFDVISLEDILIDVEHLMGHKQLSKYKVGEEIAVAQSYFETIVLHDGGFSNIGQTSRLLATAGAKNKMFVKAEYMPHRIKITNVRVEHLQDISEEDCLKEGIDRCEKEWGYWKCDSNGCLSFYSFDTIKEAFAALIDKVSGKGTWDSNPLVFVYEFELVK